MKKDPETHHTFISDIRVRFATMVDQSAWKCAQEFFFIAFFEIPGYIFAILVMDCWGHTWTNIGSFFVARHCRRCMQHRWTFSPKLT